MRIAATPSNTAAHLSAPVAEILLKLPIAANAPKATANTPSVVSTPLPEIEESTPTPASNAAAPMSVEAIRPISPTSAVITRPTAPKARLSFSTSAVLILNLAAMPSSANTSPIAPMASTSASAFARMPSPVAPSRIASATTTSASTALISSTLGRKLFQLVLRASHSAPPRAVMHPPSDAADEITFC